MALPSSGLLKTTFFNLYIVALASDNGLLYNKEKIDL